MEADNNSLLIDILDKEVSSESVKTLLSSINTEEAGLIRKDFNSVSYHSSQAHGLSLQIEESLGSERCKAIDIYNQEGVKGWTAYAGLPLKLTCIDADGEKRFLSLDIETRGAEIVGQLGEPHRKGGGEPMKGGGASGLGPGAWMEWSLQCHTRQILIMIELSGLEARGQDRWEKQRAGSARWGVCTLSLPE